MRLPELTVKRKIIATFALLSVAIIGASTYVTYRKVELADVSRTPDAMKRSYQRFHDNRVSLGTAIAAAASFVATDPSLVAALAPPERPALPAPGAPAPAVRVEPAESVLERVRDAVRTRLEADFLLVVDRAGQPVFADGSSPFTPRDLEEGKYFADLAQGMTVRASVLVTTRGVFQVSGVPVRDADGDVVGSITVGVRLEHYLETARKMGHSLPAKQPRISLVRDGRVLASVFPPAERDELAVALDPDHWRVVPDGVKEDGSPATVNVVEFKGTTYNVHADDAEGYAGASSGKIGRFILLRTRLEDSEEQAKMFEGLWYPFAAILFGAIVIGWLFSLLITRPLERFVRATESLASGEADLTQRIEITSHDEMGRLATNLNALFASLQTLAKGVQRTSFQVASSSAEISAASRQMLDGAKDQAGKVQGSSAAVTELSSSIQHVAENAVEATRVAKQSGEAVTRAIDRMQRIRSTVEQAAERILELGESGKRIGNIVEVIRQISEQTSLLALNASIEAAHAGEQGRGFAVVADEVSSLARRVGQSARDIEDLIATIKDQTAEAVRTMQAGTHEVEEGTTLVSTTLGDLKKISEVVAYTAQAVQEQAIASDEIARNMDAVQRIAQDTVSSSEEAVVQGEHLHELATGLAESVKGFRVDSDGDGVPDPAPTLPSRAEKRLPARRAQR